MKKYYITSVGLGVSPARMEQKGLRMKKYIIALVDMEYGYPPIYFAKFGDGFGTVPNRNDAFVVDESDVDEYVQ